MCHGLRCGEWGLCLGLRRGEWCPRFGIFSYMLTGPTVLQYRSY